VVPPGSDAEGHILGDVLQKARGKSDRVFLSEEAVGLLRHLRGEIPHGEDAEKVDVERGEAAFPGKLLQKPGLPKTPGSNEYEIHPVLHPGENFAVFSFPVDEALRNVFFPETEGVHRAHSDTFLVILYRIPFG
jgi:hypothetical protein